MKREALKQRIISRFGSCGEFAAKAGVSKQTVSNVIAGKHFPRNILTWCGLLEISPDDTFVFFEIKPQKTKE